MPTTGDEVDSLLVEVRASTQGFAQDIQAMRATFDTTLVGGFDRAGQVLERGLLGAIRRGSLGFDDLKRVALNALGEIAAQAAQSVFSGSFGSGGAAGGIGGLLNFGGLLGSVLGLPGRATGGPVAPGRGYLVGERGPELFVPTTSG
ncbi:MAG TPA: tail tape measure protein, partial [Novosphingobium sp.]|nr:tail tape measure protein [Novosphingobium sp.]